ncbi:membrane hypothetical protein [Candidatus Terasakiella magnetica]|uniref:Peptidase M48 domain-containing protein n=1 Tax=Candidatus Terasakiella magnetica TaxID=1867952 RepID=A0A1C3RLA9_9PROT|nr:M48 family metalloprotease [Candidatus Terasakiella magnetica]SCA57969.1 membrane hypothetical protein [Candidatus Terasakiella magnetica]
MVAVYLSIAGFILAFKLWLMARQHRYLSRQAIDSQFARQRLMVLLGSECWDTLFFALLVLYLPENWMGSGLIQSFLVCVAVLFVFSLTRWAICNVRLWQVAKANDLSQQSFADFIHISAKRLGSLLMWMVPCIFIVLLAGELGSNHIIALVVVALLGGQFIILPLFKTRLFSDLEEDRDYRLGKIPVYEDVETRQSKQANARAFGGGFASFIVYTTALKKLVSEQEFRAVLSHEKGHIVKAHHIKWVVLQSAIILISFYAFMGMNSFLNWGKGFDELLLIALVGLPLMDGLWMGLSNSVMRKFEYEADQVAAREVSAETFVSALEKIWGQNQTPHKDDALYAFFFSAHPTPDERVKRLLSKTTTTP